MGGPLLLIGVVLALLLAEHTPDALFPLLGVVAAALLTLEAVMHTRARRAAQPMDRETRSLLLAASVMAWLLFGAFALLVVLLRATTGMWSG